MTTTLSTYQTDILRILHDPYMNTYTTSDVQSAVNEARRQLVADTGCLRYLQTTYVNTSTELYPYGQVIGYMINSGGSNYTNPTITINGGGYTTQATATATVVSGVITSVTITNNGAGYMPELSPITVSITDSTGSNASISFGAISMNTLDILQVNMIWNTTRYAMDWMSWSEFSATLRTWTNWTSRPVVWAQYGEGSIYIAPPPDQTYQLEVDTICLPIDITSSSTSDPINLAYQGPIKYYAAYILKQKEQSFGEADWFREQYDKRVNEVRNQVFTRRVPSMYDQWGR
jgi:hypothetical protein